MKKTVQRTSKFKAFWGMFALVLVLGAGLFAENLAFVSHAESAAKVTASSAKIRKSADSSSEVIGSAAKDKTISIKSQTKGADGYTWYEVYVDANTLGYIRSDLVSITDGSTPPSSSTTTTTTTTTAATTTTTTTTTTNRGGAWAQKDSYRGVDVSKYQTNIDWKAVKADGIDFAMIRVGYRGSTAGQIYTDEYFEKNIAGATAAGLKVGVYFYSQAINAEEAAEEAAFVLNAIRPYKVTFPVVFDWEIVGGSDARTYTVSRAVLCESAKTFCSAVEDAGYDAMIYFTQYLGYRKYILRQLSDYEFWYAEYEAKPRIVFNFDMWQYSSTGSVNGIDGDVDLNIYFRKN